jgi:glucans biosynthesis protein
MDGIGPSLVRRRDLLRQGVALSVAGLVAPPALRTALAADADGTPFDGGTVRNIARDLSGKPFQPPDSKLPDVLAKLGYDEYRDIRFDPGHAIWHGQNLPFEVQLFHRGFIYKDKVDIYTVANGRAKPVRYSPDMFDFGKVQRPDLGDDFGFAGFRLHAPINRPNHYDEAAAFLGATYFRAVAKGQGYGLSARGLAIKTADPSGEEFPVFKSFWLERPQPGTNSMVVHALLDSPSTSGAFRFSIRPGDETVIDVESALYPRVDIALAGLAPLTSMYFFDANDRGGVDDWRPAVHDSTALLLWNGRGEQLWRPLSNPAELQVSVFKDANPRGFGLMQRKRDFHAYEDLESHFETRPSLWVEPIGDPGEGAVLLVEIPTKQEIHDNIVAFWRPAQPLRAQGEQLFNYRQHWCWENPSSTDLAKVIDTRSGAGGREKTRIFVVDVAGGDKLKSLPREAQIRADVWASEGKIDNVVAQPNPATKGWRISFELAPGGARAVELRAQLMTEDKPLSETWIYRWTP